MLTETNPNNLIFSSDYNTLKYFATYSNTITFTPSITNTTETVTITHNLGYPPYVESFVKDWTGAYHPIPSVSSGASTTTIIGVYVTSTTVVLRVEMVGFDGSTQYSHYFKTFLFKNSLGL